MQLVQWYLSYSIDLQARFILKGEIHSLRTFNTYK